MSRVIIEGYGSPIVVIKDTNGRILFDTGISIAELGLSSFDYEAYDQGEDTCIIVLNCTDVEVFNKLGLTRYQVLDIKWGYLPNMLNYPVRLYIRNIKRKYTDNGLEVELLLTDTIALLKDQKSPFVAESEDFLDYLGNLGPVKIELQEGDSKGSDGPKVVGYNFLFDSEKESIKAFEAEHKNITVDNDRQEILALDKPNVDNGNYTSLDQLNTTDTGKFTSYRLFEEYNTAAMSVFKIQARAYGYPISNVSDYVNFLKQLPPESAIQVRGEIISGGPSNPAVWDPNPNNLNGIYAREKELDAPLKHETMLDEYGYPVQGGPIGYMPVQKFQDESSGFYEVFEKETLARVREANAQAKKNLAELQNSLVGIFNQLAIPAGIKVDADNSLDAVNKILDSSEKGPFKVTDENGVVTIRNKSFSTGSRKYTWKGGMGDFLSFTYNSESHYSNKLDLVLDQFSVDPQTGDIKVAKTVIDNYVDVHSPDEMNYRTEELKARQLVRAQLVEGYKKFRQLQSEGADAMAKEFSAPASIYEGVYFFWDTHNQPGYQDDSGINKAAKDNVGASYAARYHPQFSGDGSIIEETKKLVQNRLAEFEQDKNKVTMTFIGDPYLGDSITIKLTGLSKYDSDSYYITNVKHRIDSSGYICTCEGFKTSYLPKNEVTEEVEVKKSTAKVKVKQYQVPKTVQCLDYENWSSETRSGLIGG